MRTDMRTFTYTCAKRDAQRQVRRMSASLMSCSRVQQGAQGSRIAAHSQHPELLALCKDSDHHWLLRNLFYGATTLSAENDYRRPKGTYLPSPNLEELVSELDHGQTVQAWHGTAEARSKRSYYFGKYGGCVHVRPKYTAMGSCERRVSLTIRAWQELR